MVKHLLTVNPGSSTLKLAVYRATEDGLTRLCRGLIDLQGEALSLKVWRSGQVTQHDVGSSLSPPALAKILSILRQDGEIETFDAIGHRIVHGGDAFDGPALLDEAAVSTLTRLIPLAPLHQPRSLSLISMLHDLLPGIPQTASFDTAFHQGQAAWMRRLPLPRALFDAGVKRYGFHGLSYAYIASALRRSDPALAGGRVVVAHLGSGASLCAMQAGISRDCSMGFSTLDGIPMATRSGSLDPGVLVHLLKEQAMTLPELEEMLYHRSGLLGLSGLSGDIRELLASTQPSAGEAVDHFMLRIAREIAGQATIMGGLDGIVFTAGIGEHQAAIRAGIVGHLDWLGAALDDSANSIHAHKISAPSSRVQLRVIPTDEEQMIAEEAITLLGVG
jgi:acetate kinase